MQPQGGYVMREIKPDCRQCAHIQRHYIKGNAKFVPVLCGVCRKRRLTANERKRFPWIEDCVDRAPLEERKKAQREEVKQVLQEISERLHEIAQFLLPEIEE